MSWTQTLDNAKIKEWKHDSAVAMDADIVLDAVTIPAGERRLFWYKHATGAVGSVITLSVKLYPHLSDGVSAFSDFAYIWNRDGAESTINAAILGNNSKPFHELIWGNQDIAGNMPQRLPNITLDVEFDFNWASGVETDTLDDMRLIAVYL